MRVTRRQMLERSAASAASLSLSATTARATAFTADKPTPPGEHRLWYQRPASKWVEALPVGNGRIGAMIFGGVGRERLQLNEDTLWGGGPYNPVNPEARGALDEVRRLISIGDYAAAETLSNEKLMARPISQMPYQTLGDLILEIPGLSDEADNYVRALDLRTAQATTQFTHAGRRYTRTILACPVHQVIAVHLQCDKPGGLDCQFRFETPHRSEASTTANTLILSGRNGDANGISGALRFEARLHVRHRGGALAQGDKALELSGATEATLLIAMATSFRRYDDVSGDPAALNSARIAAASTLDFATIAADARKEHTRLYAGVDLDLGTTAASRLPTDQRIIQGEQIDDPGLATLYFNYGRYLLIGSSRPGSQPANLQGIWNESLNPPWQSKYTININTEMNYWPAELTGLAECTAPLIQMVRELAESGARTAQQMYGARGWVVHHNTDLWRATAPIDGAQWGLWPTGGAWLCTHLWERYSYGRDRAYLESVYPLMRGAALFFVDTLQRDPKTGHRVTNPSNSPENPHPHGTTICAGPAMDNQILRDLFDQTIEAAAILGVDPDLAAALKTLRAKLPPDKIGAQGQLQEWMEDWDAKAPEQDHRHVSHLYGLYPSQQINVIDTPALTAAAKRTLELRGDESTGWATAWRINLWARLRDGERAHQILRFLLGPGRTYPNMFDAHPPFQIDGNFGGTAGIVEMLVQQHGDRIITLPALPRAWPKGHAYGLRARGNLTIDLDWDDGKLRSIRLASPLAGTRIVQIGDQQIRVPLSPGAPARIDAGALQAKAKRRES